LGAIRRFGFQAQVKLKPRNFRSGGLATALFSLFTFSVSLSTMKRVTLSITRYPACASKGVLSFDLEDFHLKIVEHARHTASLQRAKECSAVCCGRVNSPGPANRLF